MRIFYIMMLIGSMSLCSGSFAYARLSGTLLWDFAHYQADEGGVRKTEASSFAQRYSLLSSHQGQIMEGRGGTYDFSLGGEWWSLNSDVVNNGFSSGYSPSNSKFLFHGELTFAPGGLPFRLHMYARDTRAAIFDKGSLVSTGTFEYVNLQPKSSNVLTPRVIINVQNGTRRDFGVQMTLGIKNGSYLGRYRNILSNLPKMYFDYHELHVQDDSTRVPSNYSERDLAFVSLNKKHNWFHYRYFEHVDHLVSSGDFNESVFLLGTIDQHLRREWISLTNWVQLSTDASLVETYNRGSLQQLDKLYALNFFVLTTRQSWDSTLFSRYSREERLGYLTRELDFPFFASGQPNRNNHWRFRLLGTRELQTQPFALVNVETARDNVYSTMRWEAGHTAKNVLSTELGLEGIYGDKGDGSAIKATTEYYTNAGRSVSGPYDMFSRLSLAYFNGKAPRVGGLDLDLLEVSGRFDLAKQVTNRLRTGFGTTLVFANGQADGEATRYIRPLILDQLKGTVSRSGTASMIGTEWSAEGIWFVDYVTLSRVANRLETGLEYQSIEGGRGQYYLKHSLRYLPNRYRFDMKNEVLYGDNISRGVASRANAISIGRIEYDGLSLSHEGAAFYTPNREHRFGCVERIDWRLPDQGEGSYALGVTQEYQYTSYAQRGVERRFLQLSQYLDYERFLTESSQIFESVALTGLANYYPTSWSRLGTKLKWQGDIQVGSSDIGMGVYVDFTFSLLDIGLKYEYGMRTGDDSGSVLDRNEQSWGVSVNKTF